MHYTQIKIEIHLNRYNVFLGYLKTLWNMLRNRGMLFRQSQNWGMRREYEGVEIWFRIFTKMFRVANQLYKILLISVQIYQETNSRELEGTLGI